MSGDSVTFEVQQDYGSFGDGKWVKHLALVKWGDGSPKFDIRAWNEDMSKCGKGITLTKEELIDLYDLITAVLEEE